MQNIDLIAIGKMNAAYFAQGVAEYQKRLGGFCNFRIIELPEVQIADKNASDRQIAKALQKEGEAILASVRRGAYLVALCVEGKQVSSEDLAAMIADRAMSGAGDMAFVIGSSHGLDDSVKRAAQARISLGRITLPHQLARLVLTEQLYRACTINAGMKYHKEETLCRIGRSGSHIRPQAFSPLQAESLLPVGADARIGPQVTAKKMPRMEFASPCGAVQLRINSAADPENPDTGSRWRPSW